jgi:FkbM family methyltransferase
MNSVQKRTKQKLLSVLGVGKRRRIGQNLKGIEYELDGLTLGLPETHALPSIRKSYPIYGMNLARAAAVVKQHYPDLRVIDIGANVGDSVAIIRSKVNCPILCIEGFDDYFAFLLHNVGQLPEIELEKSYVGIEGWEMHGTIRPLRGTAGVHLNPTESKIPMRPLKDILASHPAFECAKLWKIDTDGLDTEIILNNVQAISLTRPIIFFEYDPHFFEQLNLDGFAVFERLLGANYSRALFYKNTGEYFITANLCDKRLLEDLHEAQRGKGSLEYWDICVFPDEDSQMADNLRSEEITFFRAYHHRASQ